MQLFVIWNAIPLKIKLGILVAFVLGILLLIAQFTKILHKETYTNDKQTETSYPDDYSKFRVPELPQR